MKKVGNYVLHSKIGEGQFGQVFLATKEGTCEKFAVKTMDKKKLNSNQKLRTLFETEMQIMGQIHHPNLLHLYEFLETSNNYYLIIDYCNNGDLEKHVEKNKFLGEQESVYFLMQMMNGFKELHKHKIMHRDIKLANIFLNDDNIIIGDFGFAKSGSDMATTKLGSPLTMAPELLSGGPNDIYTNKADLWSIGICFFQMIFGNTPWPRVRSMKELEHKVRVESGNNLPIPSLPAVSDECRDLLRRLITYDPSKRIEWDEFFNHSIFAQKPVKEEGFAEGRQSVMFKNNHNKVTSLFKQNQETAVTTRKVRLFSDPLKIKIEGRCNYKQQVEDQERIVSMASRRYTHEKKSIVFMIHTCRRLRNLAKQRPYFQNASNGLMFVAILLLRKAMILNEKAINSIQSKTNLLAAENFDLFASSDIAKNISKELIRDHSLYQNLMDHLLAKTREEIDCNEVNARAITSLSGSKHSTQFEVTQELVKHSRFMIEYQAQLGHQLPKALNHELKIALAQLYIGCNSERELPAVKGGVDFDWIIFERSLNSGEIDRILERAI